MKRTLASLALAAAMALTSTVSDVRAASYPEVHVIVVAAPDGFQIDWFGPNSIEPGEEWCSDTACVNATLAKIGQEWTYSVAWRRV